MGSQSLSRIYELWRKENGFDDEYMDDLLSGNRLNRNQRDWLEVMEREYLRALKHEKRWQFLSRPGVIIIISLCAVMTIIYLSIPEYASDECKRLIYDNSFGMIILGSFIGYFVKALQPSRN